MEVLWLTLTVQHQGGKKMVNPQASTKTKPASHPRMSPVVASFTDNLVAFRGLNLPTLYSWGFRGVVFLGDFPRQIDNGSKMRTSSPLVFHAENPCKSSLFDDFRPDSA